jgi:hypothetical protein
MYNSNNLCTWDETIPYVQHSYNKSIHISINHIPFQVGLDFNHWVPWMLQYALHPHRKNCPMQKLKKKNPPDSLNESNTFPNRFRIFCRIPMPSTSSTMINIECHKSFRWEIKFCCTCRKNSLQDPIRSFLHSAMELIPSPRLWVTMILSSTFPPSLDCTQCLMWTSFGHTFHHYWTPQR